MEKIISINGQDMRMVANARTPRLYRAYFGRDIIVDMRKLVQAHSEGEFKVDDLTVFENVAWLFLKQGGEEVGSSADDWLDTIDGVFSIYEVLPQIVELWGMNTETLSKAKKK